MKRILFHKTRNDGEQGASLMEVVIVVTLFLVLAVGISTYILPHLRSTSDSSEYARAANSLNGATIPALSSGAGGATIPADLEYIRAQLDAAANQVEYVASYSIHVCAWFFQRTAAGSPEVLAASWRCRDADDNPIAEAAVASFAESQLTEQQPFSAVLAMLDKTNGDTVMADSATSVPIGTVGAEVVEPPPAPTDTPLSGSTFTATATATATATGAATNTPTPTPTIAPSPTPTATITPTASATVTATGTATATTTATATSTGTATTTATATVSATATGTSTSTPTLTATATATVTLTPTITRTPTITPTPSITPTATITSTPTITRTPTATPTEPPPTP